MTVPFGPPGAEIPAENLSALIDHLLKHGEIVEPKGLAGRRFKVVGALVAERETTA